MFSRINDVFWEKSPDRGIGKVPFHPVASLYTESLRDWTFKRQLMLDQLTALKQDIDKGLADVAAGRTREFDAQRIAEHFISKLQETCRKVLSFPEGSLPRLITQFMRAKSEDLA